MRLRSSAHPRGRFPADDRAGAAIVELGFAVPLILLLVVGVINFGQLFFASITLSNAAEAGALYGAQSNGHAADQNGIKNAALQDAKNMKGVSITSKFSCKCPPSSGSTESVVDCKTGTCTAGNYGVPRVYVEVTASATVDLMFKHPAMESLTNMSRTATFRTQ